MVEREFVGMARVVLVAATPAAPEPALWEALACFDWLATVAAGEHDASARFAEHLRADAWAGAWAACERLEMELYRHLRRALMESDIIDLGSGLRVRLGRSRPR